MNTRIIFLGTPYFAETILEKIIRAGYDVPAVFTQPDKKIGRKQKVVFSPVKQLARDRNLRIYQPENLKDPETIENIRKLSPDLIVVAAYGKILPKVILEIPRFGCVNVHASLLPKYRGASPIQSAILSGEKETGVTLMLMDEKMDEGDIIALEKTKIGKTENAGSLSVRLAEIGGELLTKIIPQWTGGKIKAKRQDGRLATYSRPITKEDGKISWEWTAEEIFRHFLAFQPWPGIWTEIRDKNASKRLKLVEVSADFREGDGENFGKVIKYGQGAAVKTGKGMIIFEKIQLEGKKETSIAEYLRGNQNLIGNQLG